MRSSFLLLFLTFSIAISGTKIKEQKAIVLHPRETTNELRISSNGPTREKAANNPQEGIVIGNTDYDHALNNGFARRIAAYDNGNDVHMVFMERDVMLASPENRSAIKYVYYKSSDGSMISSYPRPKGAGATGFGSIDVIPTGASAGKAVITYTSETKTYFAIDGGPGQGQFTETLFPNADTTYNIFTPQVTAALDGNTIWFSASLNHRDYLVAKTTDYGVTWNGIDSLKKYAPQNGYALSSESSPILIAPNNTLYILATLQGNGSLPPLGDAHPDSADCIGYFKSTDNGSNWSWTTIGKDGDALVVQGDTVYTLYENFSQFSGSVDSGDVLHVVSNGYCLKLVNDSTVSNRFYTLYYNSSLQEWKIISDPQRGKSSEYDSSYYKYHGNAIGNAYPTISTGKGVIFAAWSEPVFNNGKLDIVDEKIQYQLLYSYSGSSGSNWSDQIQLLNSTGALFSSLHENVTTVYSHSAKFPIIYLADTSRGSVVVDGTDPVQVPWVYREVVPYIIDAVPQNAPPEKFSLSQNYPNPFNPTTTIRYSVRSDNVVTIAVYDLLGRRIATVFDGFQNAGEYTVTFDASQLSSGVYIYKMTAGSFTAAKKMVLQK